MAFPGREVSNPVEHYHVDHLTTRLAEQDVRLDLLGRRMDTLEAQLVLLESWVRECVGVDKPSGP